MFEFFKRAAGKPLIAFVVFAFTLGYVVGFTGMLQHVQSDAGKIVYTVAGIAIVTTYIVYIIVGFVAPIYNRTTGDDDNANFYSYAFAFAGKICAMSMIYTTLWVWKHATFKEIHASSVLGTWLYFAELATYIAVGTAAPSLIDTTSPFSGIVSAVDIYISKMLELCTAGIIASNFYHFTKRQNREREQAQSVTTPVSKNYHDDYGNYLLTSYANSGF